MASDHDGIYKELFSHPCMVADLLAHFAPPDWACFSQDAELERINGSFVCDDATQRHCDMAWCLRAGAQHRYVLLEFQSAPDPTMPLRMLVYTGLLYQELLKTGEVDQAEALPPVLPLVLYNGKQAWRVPCELVHEGEPGIQLRHHVIDQRRLGKELLEQPSSVTAAIFRAELTGEAFDFMHAMTMLDQWSAQDARSFGLASTAWARLHAGRSFNWPIDGKFSSEVDTMFNGELYRYVQAARQQAQERGLEEGRQVGWQIGRQEGRQEGLSAGRLEGQRDVLYRLFECRLGTVPGALAERIREADAAEVEQLMSSLIERFKP